MLALLALAPPAEVPRALWVWQSGKAMRNDPVKRKGFFAFLDAPRGDSRKAIRVVFFGGVSKADLLDPAEAARVSDFIRDAHRHKVRVDYLCGDAQWALPEGHEEALGQLRTVLAYNKAAGATAKFDGFQYDVEPYLLKSWPAASTIESYLLLLTKARAASAGRLFLGAAIPRWFDRGDLNGLYKSVSDRTDYVAVMDYVDSAKAFVDDGRNEVEYASASGKQTWLGLETQELKDEPRATFYAAGEAVAEDAISAATKAHGGKKGFAGVAIHYYDSYLDLRP